METGQESICCPPFDPVPCDRNLHWWTDKKFIRDAICTLFYMPVHFGAVISLTGKLIRAPVEPFRIA